MLNTKWRSDRPSRSGKRLGDFASPSSCLRIFVVSLVGFRGNESLLDLFFEWTQAMEVTQDCEYAWLVFFGVGPCFGVKVKGTMFFFLFFGGRSPWKRGTHIWISLLWRCLSSLGLPIQSVKSILPKAILVKSILVKLPFGEVNFAGGSIGSPVSLSPEQLATCSCAARCWGHL